MVQCEECISLALCLTQITFEKNDYYPHGYRFLVNPCLRDKCNYYDESCRSDKIRAMNEWYEFKEFFMLKKGMIFQSLIKEDKQ